MVKIFHLLTMRKVKLLLLIILTKGLAVYILKVTLQYLQKIMQLGKGQAYM